jgi:hypothetical protein
LILEIPYIFIDPNNFEEGDGHLLGEGEMILIWKFQNVYVVCILSFVFSHLGNYEVHKGHEKDFFFSFVKCKV